MKGIFGAGEAAVAHVVRITLQGFAGDPAEFGVAAGVLGGEILKESEYVVQHLNLSVALHAGADPDGRDGQRP